MGRIKENDFKENVKKAAGCAVAYRCTFEGCNAVLVCRKEGTDEIQNIAQYCHIAAASPNGPRFDASLTNEQIRGLDNCIVMCSNHHHIIDNNPSIYTTELLKKWKAEKEERTRIEMNNGSLCEDSNLVEAVFDSYLKIGNFEALSSKIEDYKKMGNSELQEVVSRFEIFISVLFGFETKDLIDSYIKAGYKRFNKLALFFIEFYSKEYLQKIISFVDNLELADLINKVLSNEPAQIIGNPEIAGSMDKIDLNLKIKLIMNYTFRNTNMPCLLMDSNKKEIGLYKDESYYDLLSFLLDFRKIAINPNEFEKDLVIDSISRYISVIDRFDTKLKVKIYSFILPYLAETNDNLFFNYYNRLSPEEKETEIIADISFKHRIYQNDPKLTIDEVDDYCRKNKNYKILFIYLSQNTDIAKTFLEDNLYLLKKDSTFLILYHNCVDNGKFKEEISKLKENYVNDFTYNCILWNLDIENENMKKWCLENENRIDNYNIDIYFMNLILSHENEHFFEIIDQVWPIEKRVHYLNFFTTINFENEKYYEILIEKYQQINEIKIIEGVNINLGLLLLKVGKENAAIKCWEKENDLFGNSKSIAMLLNFRLEKGFYLKDKYFDKCLKSVEYTNLVYVAETYFNHNEMDSALFFYERALITGGNSKACLFKIFEITNKGTLTKRNEIDDNVTITIECEGNNRTIVFHKYNIIENLDLGKNEWIDACLDLPDFSIFRYKKVGDKVTFRNRDVKILSIQYKYDFYAKKFFENACQEPSTITVGGSKENAIEEIKEILKGSFEHNRKLKEKFRKFKDILPLSVISKTLFNNRIINSVVSLYSDSSEKILNNTSIVIKPSLKRNMIFYYDALFVLFTISREIEINLPDYFYITDYEKNRLNNEINEMIRDIKNNSTSIGLDESGNLIRFGFYDKQNKANSLTQLTTFLDFINKFNVLNTYDYDLQIDGQKIANDVFDFNDEKSIFSNASKDNSFVVVSDFRGFVSLCDLLKIENIGIPQIVSLLLEPEEVIKSSLILKKMNYDNYFTLNMYIIAKDSCDEKMKEFLNMIFDTDEENLKHRRIIKQNFLVLKALQWNDEKDEILSKEFLS
ncbi:MAG: hypothetical protein K6E21_04065 [Bacilli bacterium]|nr:hypothetical protein [Bacilli bacterium]